MNVDEFQLHLTDLSNLLRRAGGKKVADEFDEVCAALQPYRDRRMKDFLSLLANAEEIVRSGVPLAKPAKTKSKKADSQTISAAIDRVRDLYNRALDPATTRDEIEAACKVLADVDPPKSALDGLAREMLISEKLKSKPVAIERIKQAILLRKGSYQRAQV